jgi:hypothetical protein
MTAVRKPVRIALVATCLVGFNPAQAQQQPGWIAPSVRLAPQPDAASDDPSTGAAAGESATDLAKKLQNPIGDLISVPFQSNTNFNVGPNKGTQEILNIQPVIPIHLNDDWNLITRTIVPLIWSPSFQPGQSVPPFGLAPTSFSAFLSPKNPVDGWIWGVGPVASCRRSPARPSAPMSGDSDRPPSSSNWPVRSLPGHWSTMCSRLVAPRALEVRNTAGSRSIRSSITTWAKAGLLAASRSSLPPGRLPATRPELCL